MTSVGWPEIEHVYLQASGLAPADRAAFLDQACAGRRAGRMRGHSSIGQILHVKE